MESLRDELTSLLMRYSDADYLYSEENGKKPDKKRYVDAILQAIKERLPQREQTGGGWSRELEIEKQAWNYCLDAMTKTLEG